MTFKDNEELTRLTQRHEELMQAIHKSKHTVDGRGRIVGSELATDFAPMPLWNLAAMVMIRNQECTHQQGWDLADTKDRELAYESRGRERELVRISSYFQHVLFTHAPRLDVRDLLKHTNHMTKPLVLAACVRPFDWKVVAGIHRQHGLIGYSVDCLATNQSAVLAITKGNPHEKETRDRLLAYTHPELTEHLDAYKMIQVLAPLRTVA